MERNENQRVSKKDRIETTQHPYAQHSHTTTTHTRTVLVQSLVMIMQQNRRVVHWREPKHRYTECAQVPAVSAGGEDLRAEWNVATELEREV